MNTNKTAKIECYITGFRPQQGLPIMNSEKTIEEIEEASFRPQQGLPIMNKMRI